MKVGVRKLSVKKSIKARTTGKYKRKLKRMVNPFYGKKGMGWIKNPSRAFKNKIYHKTTISTKSLIKKTSNIFVAFLYYCIWIPCKYMVILMFLMYKYILLGLGWLITALYNGIISLVEYIINIGKEEASSADEIVDSAQAEEKEQGIVNESNELKDSL